MTARSWIRKLFAPATTAPIVRRPRLGLEALEAREVPATFTVTNLLDDASPGSLRWAVGQANTASGADTINFASGLGGQTITLASQLVLTDTATTTVDGGAGGVVIDGNNGTRLFVVDAGAEAAFNRLTLTRGRVVNGDGGGVYNSGTLTVTNSALVNNAAQGADGSGASARGGGVYNVGTLTISGSNLTGNSATGGHGADQFSFAPSGGHALGGGVYNAGSLTIANNVLENNSASGGRGGNSAGPGLGSSHGGLGRGGAIYNANSLVATNSIFTGNTATGGNGGSSGSGNATGGNSGNGGAVFNAGTLTVSDSHLNGNAAIGGSGGSGGFGYLNGPGGVGGGGAIENANMATVLRSTFNDNGAAGGGGGSSYDAGASGGSSYGGAISNAATFTAINSTFARNAASGGHGGGSTFDRGGQGGGGYGGGIYNGASLTVQGSTFAGNNAASGSGGVGGGGSGSTGSGSGGGLLHSGSGTAAVSNSLLVGNSASTTGAEVSGTVTNLSSLIGVPGGFTLGQVVEVDGNGRPWLKDNGGPTQTIALVNGSPAIGVGLAGLTATDQRGLARNAAPDLGAFETQVPSLAVTASGGTYDGTAYGVPTVTVTGPYGVLTNAGTLSTVYTNTATSATSSTAPTNAGSYSVTVTFTPTAAGYRTATSAPVSFSIAQRAITVTADARTKVYGAADPALTYAVTAGSVVAGDYFSGGLTRAAGETVGTYAISQSSLTLGGNYAVTFAGAAFSITPAGSTTGLAVSQPTPLFGTDGLTLTATVSTAAGPLGGTVTFKAGTAVLGTATLVNGTATLSLGSTALAAGGYTLTAEYSGDANHSGSQGAAAVTVLAPATVQGLVYVDANNNGQVDFGETAVQGVLVTLTGVNDLGQSVSLTATTTSAGVFTFTGLRPSAAAGYTLTETQPGNLSDGLDTPGTVNGLPTGAAGNDVFSGVVLSGGAYGENYNFGERQPTGGGVVAGQTAAIGFWQNRNGQNLIKSLNGGATATQLGNWLAATFPNMYGSLAGKSNAQVAAFYKTLFALNGQTAPGGPPKMDAQVMATALAVYVTKASLGGTAGVAYGFRVDADGVGSRTVNVGANGAAFGVANSTSVSVLDLLLAVNARSHNGRLFDLDRNGQTAGLEVTYRTMANDLFSAINELGSI
jgi:hypothetical protein